ncbi:MAG: hypothetical protein ACREQA_07845 [Candidatus Binatia bacterium]
MVFSYYKRLTRAQQRIYRLSDEVSSIRLPTIGPLSLLVERVAEALPREDRRETEAACQRLMSVLTTSLKVSPVRVEVLAVRPSRSWGELHGLYNPPQGRRPPKITVWMRTAERHQVVAFRTFLRTLIHELCHHLDYELLRLQNSFHTEGFYKRESSLFHQLTSDHLP